MVKLTQLGEQDEADGKRGKTGGLRGQPKFGGGVQQQEGDGDVFINDIWNKNRVFQTAFLRASAPKRILTRTDTNMTAAMFRCTCARNRFKSPLTA